MRHCVRSVLIRTDANNASKYPTTTDNANKCVSHHVLTVVVCYSGYLRRVVGGLAWGLLDRSDCNGYIRGLDMEAKLTK